MLVKAQSASSTDHSMSVHLTLKGEVLSNRLLLWSPNLCFIHSHLHHYASHELGASARTMTIL